MICARTFVLQPCVEVQGEEHPGFTESFCDSTTYNNFWRRGGLPQSNFYRPQSMPEARITIGKQKDFAFNRRQPNSPKCTHYDGYVDG